jgi:hypothetical protein
VNLKKLAASLAVATATFAMGTAHAVPVALELAVVIDVSDSVSATEYFLQRDGYEARRTAGFPLERSAMVV